MAVFPFKSKNFEVSIVLNYLVFDFIGKSIKYVLRINPVIIGRFSHEQTGFIVKIIIIKRCSHVKTDFFINFGWQLYCSNLEISML